ncbi:lipopolysaccharide biosynthesis protein, partial [Paludibacteraceae bacterium OttesenSCG-928-F17]|nr:lipopolysaccharide biosynthesis protein [Paludibacteraceae bacterium OttesenSCG-928-F17]
MGVIIRQSIKGTIINYIGTFIGFITTMFIVTKFLAPEDIGLTKVIMEVGLLFSSLALLGTSSSILRFFPYFRDKEKENNGFFFYIMALPFIGCLIFIPLYIILKEPITDFFIKNSSLFVSYFYWVIPLIFFLTYWFVFESYSNVHMRIVGPKFIREIILKILLVVVYLLYGFQVIGRDGLVGSYIAVHGVAMVATFLYVSRIAPITFKHDNSFVGKELRKDIAKYTVFLLVGALGSNLLNRLDIFMISSQMGLNYTGAYTIAFYMAQVIEIPSRSITAISSATAATYLREGKVEDANRLYKKVSLNQLLIGGIVFVLVWSNIDNIFKIMPNGETYAIAKWVVLFIGFSKLIDTTLSFGGILISFSKYYYWSLYFVFIIAGIGILTNYLLIPVLGVSGAAIATLISTMLSLSFQQWIVQRKIKANPLTKGTLISVIIILVLFGINYLLPQVANFWIDIIYRSSILGLLAFLIVFVTKVSPEFNGVVV